MVIARCLGPECFFMERVVFPFELLSFQCPEDSELEIWTHGLGGAELLESIPVGELLSDDATDTSDAPGASVPLPFETLSAIDSAA